MEGWRNMDEKIGDLELCRVMKFWEAAQKGMHHITARGWLLGAGVERVDLSGC